MSKPRLEMLQRLLKSHGWEILNETDPKKYGGLYDVVVEMITWTAIHRKNRIWIELNFSLFGDMGQPTSDLMDISYCDVEGHDIRLYFTKINRDEWQSRLDAFIDELASLKPSDGLE